MFNDFEIDIPTAPTVELEILTICLHNIKFLKGGIYRNGSRRDFVIIVGECLCLARQNRSKRRTVTGVSQEMVRIPSVAVCSYGTATVSETPMEGLRGTVVG